MSKKGNENQTPKPQPVSQDGSTNEEDQLLESQAPAQTPESQGSNQPPTDLGTQSEFSHRLLQGKTPGEVDTLFASLEAANREQAKMVNDSRAAADLAAAKAMNAPSGVRVTDESGAVVTSADYWDDPVGAMTKILDDKLSKVIQPFAADLSISRAQGLWAQVGAQYPDLPQYKPLIDQIISANPGVELTAGILESYYLLAVGMVARNPNVATAPSAPAPTPTASRPAPPQHGASKHPMPSPNAAANALPNLSETELRLAREMNPGLSRDEQIREYYRWQQMPDDEVVTSERSVSNA